MTIYGNAVQSNLPSGYTEVGYIESSGTQYIDTGICPTNNTKVEVVFNSSIGNRFVYGSRIAPGAENTFAFFFDTISTTNHFQFGSGTEATALSMKLNTKYMVSLSQEGGYLDGELKESYDTQSFVSDLPLYLCGINQTGAEERAYEFRGKIYSFKVYENNVLIQSLVPCIRDIDGAIGMYDTVSNTFLVNSGTGVFTAGAAVTPTPDTPVDIQLCGDATGNLYNVNDKYKTWNTAVTDDDGWITINYNNTKGTADFWSSLFTNFRDVIEPNTQYTLVTEIEYISGGLIYVTTRATDNNISPFNTHVAYSAAGTYCSTVTSKSNLSDCNVLLRTFGCTRAGDTLTAKFRISLLKGSYTAETIPAYEPYGYKVSGRIEGVNLYNVNDKYETWNTAVTDDAGWITVNYDNTEGTSNNWPSLYTKFRDVIEPNTEYTIVTEIEYISGCTLYPATTRSPKPAFNTTFSYTQQGTHYRTVTSESDLSDCVLLLRSNYRVEAGNIASAKFRISLLKGSYTADTIPPYEPYQPPQDFAVYLPQQIAKVGDVADTVVLDMEKRTATLVQRTKEIVFDGTENWIASVNISNIREFKLYIDSIFRSNYVYCFSNRYKVAYDTKDHCTYIARNNPVVLHIADNSFTTTAEFKAWLSELYASGEPLKYLFELATPVTTDITAMQDWDAMPQVKGTVTLTLSAEVEPSGAEAVYYSKEYDVS